MKIRKSIALLLVTVMMCAALAACGGGGDDASTPPPAADPAPATPAPEPPAEVPQEEKLPGHLAADQYGLPYSGMEGDEPITVTRLVDASATEKDPNNPFTIAMEAITNIKVVEEFIIGDPREKIGVLVASGDLPDMVNVGVGEQPMLYQAGAYMALQDAIERWAPNYRQQFDKYWDFLFTPDGNMYIVSIWGLPSGDNNPIGYNGCAFYIQKAVLDHFGRAPANIEEYFQFLREYKELYPEIDGVPTVGFLAEMHDWRTWSLVHPSKFLNGYGNWGDAGVADMVNHVAFDPYVEPWYKDYFTLLNEQFHLGLIPAETFTYDHDLYMAQLASGAVLGMFDQQWNFGSAEDLLKTEGKVERTYIPLGLTANASIRPHYIDNGNFEANNGFGIAADSPNAERILKLVNYIIQEPVQTWLSWGIEGEHYEVVDGRYIRFEEQRANELDPQWVRDNMGRWIRDMWPKVDGTFTNGNATGPATQNEEAWVGLFPYEQELFTKLGIESRIAYLGDPVDVTPYYPFWAKRTFNGDGSDADFLWNDSVRIVREYTTKLVVAPEGQFDALYDEFMTEYQKQDLTPLFDALNADVQRWMSMLG